MTRLFSLVLLIAACSPLPAGTKRADPESLPAQAVTVYLTDGIGLYHVGSHGLSTGVPFSGAWGISSLAYDPVERRLYAVGGRGTRQNPDLTATVLFIVEPATGTCTEVASFPIVALGSYVIESIAFSPTGQLYATRFLGWYGDFNNIPLYGVFRVDLPSRSFTQVYTYGGYTYGFAFDSQGYLWIEEYFGRVAQIYQVNLATGQRLTYATPTDYGIRQLTFDHSDRCFMFTEGYQGGSSRLARIDPKTGRVLQVLSGDLIPTAPNTFSFPNTLVAVP